MLKRQKINLIFLGIILLAAGLRLYRLGYADFIPDEGHYALDAFEYFSQNSGIVPRFHTQYHYAGQMGHPFLGEWLMALTYRIFNPSVFSARLVSALSGIISTLLIYFTAKVLFRRKPTALIASLAYALLPLAVKFDRTTYGDSLQTMFLLAFLLFYLKFLRAKTITAAVILGITTGLLLLTKLSAVLVLIFLAAQFIFTRNQFNSRKAVINLAVLFVSALAVFFLGANPKAYLIGIVSPTDQNLAFNSLWVNFATVKQNLLSVSLLTLIPLPLLALTILGIIKAFKQKKSVLLLVYFFSWLPLFLQLLTNEGAIYRTLPVVVIGIFFAADYLAGLTHFKKSILLAILFAWSFYASLKWGLMEPLRINPLDQEIMDTISSAPKAGNNRVYLYETPRNYFFWNKQLDFIIDENFYKHVLNQTSVGWIVSRQITEADSNFNQTLMKNNFTLVKKVSNMERNLLLFQKNQP